MSEDENFPTIRQAAKRGPLSESRLRLLLKQGKLPGFYVGTHYRVNYRALISILDEESRKGKSIF